MATFLDETGLAHLWSKIKSKFTPHSEVISSASVEESSTASQPYTAGEYLVRDGVLRKVTTAIAMGGVIDDSNSEATTVANELHGEIEFSLDAEGKAQYRVIGASEWTPFLSGAEYLAVFGGTKQYGPNSNEGFYWCYNKGDRFNEFFTWAGGASKSTITILKDCELDFVIGAFIATSGNTTNGCNLYLTRNGETITLAKTIADRANYNSAFHTGAIQFYEGDVLYAELVATSGTSSNPCVRTITIYLATGAAPKNVVTEDGFVKITTQLATKGTHTIQHGLGKVPELIIAMADGASGSAYSSYGVYSTLETFTQNSWAARQQNGTSETNRVSPNIFTDITLTSFSFGTIPGLIDSPSNSNPTRNVMFLIR